MEINQMPVPAGLKNNPNKNMKAIHYITIHCTGNYNATATAYSHAKYQYNGGGGAQASWHYTVDKDSIWQSFDDTRMCWHAADGSGPGNASSIGIEICVNDRVGFPAACRLAAELTAELLKKYGLGIADVKEHHDWSGKDCPYELRSGKWGLTWGDFIGMVASFMADEQTTPVIAPEPVVDEPPAPPICIGAPSGWATEAALWAVGARITDGIDPQGTCTREMMWTMLHRMYNLITTGAANGQ